MKFAEFKVVLPSGGRFYAAWPQRAPASCLTMVQAMLNATLQHWIESDARRSHAAAEAEYQSWFKDTKPGGANG